MSARKDDGIGLACSAAPRTGSSTMKSSNKKHMMPKIGVRRTPHCQVLVHSDKAEPVAYPNPLKSWINSRNLPLKQRNFAEIYTIYSYN